MELTVSEFESRFRQVVDDVQARHEEVLITRDGRAVAKLVPMDAAAPGLFGRLAGSVQIHGDLIEPLDEAWDADA